VRALVAILAVAAGCGFHPEVSSDAGGGEPGSDADLEAMPGSEPLSFVAPCYAPDPTGLVLCLELDDPGLAQAGDGSPGHHDAAVTAANVATRDLPATSQAAQIVSTSVIQTESSTDFDLQRLTLTAWVRREGTPATNGKYGLVHTFGQYYMALDDQGRVFCAIEDTNTVYVRPGDATTLDQWDFVACTFDGTELCAWRFPGDDGSNGESTCGQPPNTVTLNTGLAAGVSVGSIATTSGHTSHLAGRLDAARVYGKALDQQHLCEAGGFTNC
jgi:Concanavalin A-like lectin/glucanases superfamily